MRIAIVNAPRQRGGALDCAKALGRGMESRGHRVDVFDIWTEDGSRLPGYEYIVVVAESASLFRGRMPSGLSKFFSVSNGLVGKKGAAFLHKTSPFTAKALSNLMKAMEKEGMWVNWFDTLINPSQAESIGKRIGT